MPIFTAEMWAQADITDREHHNKRVRKLCKRKISLLELPPDVLMQIFYLSTPYLQQREAQQLHVNNASLLAVCRIIPALIHQQLYRYIASKGDWYTNPRTTLQSLQGCYPLQTWYDVDPLQTCDALTAWQQMLVCIIWVCRLSAPPTARQYDERETGKIVHYRNMQSMPGWDYGRWYKATVRAYKRTFRNGETGHQLHFEDMEKLRLPVYNLTAYDAMGQISFPDVDTLSQCYGRWTELFGPPAVQEA